MAYRGEHYKGSIVHRFGGYDKPEICANCVRWSKSTGCSVKKRRSPTDRCNIFQFAKYANYKLDGNGGVEYNDEYLAYLERKRARKSEVRVSYIGDADEGEETIGEEEAEGRYSDEFEALDDLGLEYIDNRPNGALWVVGGKEIGDLLDGLSAFGLAFHFKKGGGRASGKRDAWWSK